MTTTPGMKRGEPIDARIPYVRAIHDLDEARDIRSPARGFARFRRAAERVGDHLREGPQVVSVRTLPLTTLLYPTAFAFNGAALSPTPFVVMTHRCLLVQVRAEGELKNILFNPTEYEASLATPYFAKLLDKTGERLARTVTTQFGSVEEQLRTHGLSAEDIDLIAFDHFHTQDLRPILGCDIPNVDGVRLANRYPNAYLLAPRIEWEDWDDLHPMQRSWFIEDGKRGVPEDRVILTENDLMLGDGCLLMRTPGHTTGNQTIFCHGERGVFGCSENGTSADNWAPYESRIAGIRSYTRQYELEVVLNANTPELAAEQYASMVLEKSIVDRSEANPAFVQMFPSSEVTPSLLAPGITPAMLFHERDSGRVATR